MNLERRDGIVPANDSEEATTQESNNTAGLIGLIIGVIALSLCVIASIVFMQRGRRRTKRRLVQVRQRQIQEQDSLLDEPDDDSKSKNMVSTITSLPLLTTNSADADADTVSTASTPPRSLESSEVEEQPIAEETTNQIPWTSEEALFWLNHPVGEDGEVQHECSAATCHLCEVRRQRGIQFDRKPTAPLPSAIGGMATTNATSPAQDSNSHRSPVYEDSMRHYSMVFEDTVDL